jgi:hypothetical protein
LSTDERVFNVTCACVLIGVTGSFTASATCPPSTLCHLHLFLFVHHHHPTFARRGDSGISGCLPLRLGGSGLTTRRRVQGARDAKQARIRMTIVYHRGSNDQGIRSLDFALTKDLRDGCRAYHKSSQHSGPDAVKKVRTIRTFKQAHSQSVCRREVCYMKRW